MKDKLFDKYIRKSILASVIASLLVIIFIKPILNYIYEILVKLSQNIFVGLIDSLYSNAALGQRNHLDLLTLLILSVAIFIFASRLSRKLKRTTDKLIDLYEERRDLLTNEYTEPKRNDEELDDEQKIQYAESKISELKKDKKKDNIIGFCVIFILSISLIYLLTLGFVDLQLNTSFNQRLTVIRPQIEERVELELKSDWAKMSNRIDFLRLNSKMDSIASVKEIELPELLLK